VMVYRELTHHACRTVVDACPMTCILHVRVLFSVIVIWM
jgi:hypothetical protein